MEDKFLESIAYILPAVVTGFVAQYMFKGFLQQQNNDKKLHLLSEKKRDLLPNKLKAYERMLLFSDRMNPTKLIVRVLPISDNKNDYASLLEKTIEQELEHNLVQQLYISDEAWEAIISAKKIIQNQLHQIADSSKTMHEFKEKVFLNSSNFNDKIEIVTSVLKNDVRKLL